jgi:dynein heavy chain
MNMPRVDDYGTQQPIALLKLLLERGGMYDRGKDLNWKLFKDLFFFASMGKVSCYIRKFVIKSTAKEKRTLN